MQAIFIDDENEKLPSNTEIYSLESKEIVRNRSKNVKKYHILKKYAG